MLHSAQFRVGIDVFFPNENDVTPDDIDLAMVSLPMIVSFGSSSGATICELTVARTRSKKEEEEDHHVVMFYELSPNCVYSCYLLVRK
jgi:hypothetical protein